MKGVIMNNYFFHISNSFLKKILLIFFGLIILIVFSFSEMFAQNRSRVNDVDSLLKSVKGIKNNDPSKPQSGEAIIGLITLSDGRTMPNVIVRVQASGSGCANTDATTVSSPIKSVQSSVFYYNYRFDDSPNLELGNCNNRIYTISVSDTLNYYTGRFTPNVRYTVVPSGFIVTDYDFQALPFPSPTLIAPKNDSTGLPLNPTLNWSLFPQGNTSDANRKKYQIQVSLTSNFSSLVLDTLEDYVGGLSNSKQLGGLTQGTKYFWRVRNIYYVGATVWDTSAWSPTYNFRTILATPTLILPVNNFLGTSLTPTLVWNTVNGADSYRVQVSTNSSFTSKVFDTVVTTTSVVTSQLNYNTTYYWRVFAKTNAGDSSAPSSTWNFKTKLSSPNLISPNDGSYAVPIPSTLKWFSVTGASSYRVQVSTNNGFSTIVKDLLVTSDSANIFGLLNGTNYFWRVKAYSNTSGTAGDSSDWSYNRQFMTKLSLPVLISPISNSYVSRNPLLTWNEVTGKSSYNIQYVRVGTTDTVRIFNVLTEAYGLAGLEIGETYSWRVKAKNSGDSTGWTSSWTFTVTGSIPSLVAPLNAKKITTLDTTLIWNSVPNADTYTLEYADNPSFSSSTQITGLTNTYYVFDIDETNSSNYYKTFYWRVKAIIGGTETEWSSAWTFTTNIYKPSLLSPINHQTNVSTNPTFSWNVTPGAETYLLQVSSSNTDWSTPVINVNVLTTTYTPASSLTPGTYYWRVRAYNSFGQISNFSDIWDFTSRKWNITGNVSIQGNGPITNHKVYLFDNTMAAVDSALTDLNGNYQLSANAGNIYFVIPADTSGYDFIPSQRQIFNLSADYNNQNFVASLKLFKISGKITLVPSGVLENVTVKLSNGMTTLTDNNGNYEFLVNALGNYTVTPEKLGYSFAKKNASDSTIYKILGDSVLNFDAEIKKFKISGTVYDNGTGLDGVILQIYKNGNLLDSTITYDGGKYVFLNLEALQNYSVVVKTTNGAGYGKNFYPAQGLFYNLLKDELQDFVTSINLRKISGQIRTSSFLGINNITVKVYSPNFNSSALTQTASKTGVYSLYIPDGATYTIEPLYIPDQGYRFKNTDNLTLSTRTISISGSDVDSLNFLADTAVYKISGFVKIDGLGQNGILVRLDSSGGYRTFSTITNGSDGYYEFFVKGLKSFTVTPQSTIYYFEPSSKTFANLIGDQYQDFNSSDKKTYPVTGYAFVGLMPIPNVQITVTGVPSYTTVTDANGKYSFTAIAGQSYQVVASKPGLTFINSPLTTPTIIDTTKLDTLWANRNLYNISGTVYNFDSTRLSGVTVYCSYESVTIQSTTDSTGNYSFTLSGGINYQIRPEKTGFVFNPTVRNYPELDMNYTSQDFRAEQSTVLVTGYVKINNTSNGLEGVQVVINGNPSAVTLTDASGKYTFTALVGQAYNITATKAGWNVINSPLATGTITGSTTLSDLLATPLTFTVSGKVVDFDGSTPLSNVVVSCYNGTHTRTYITNSTGIYSFTVSADSNYLITPNKTNLVFNPLNRSYQKPSDNYSNQDFKAEQNAVTVTGRVVKVGTTIGLKDVIITVNDNLSTVTTATDDNGEYSFTALVGRSYSISGTKTGWSISSLSNVLVTGAMSVPNLIATPYSYTISGKVMNFDSTLLSGVTVSCNNGTYTRSLITGITGEYSFTVSADSNYIITPSKTGFIFNPNNRIYYNPTQDLTNENFKAEQNAITITGYVYKTGTTTGVKDVIISVNGNPNSTTATDNSGKYTFTALVGQSYNIYGSKNGWKISPYPLNTGVLSGSTTVNNIYATPDTFNISGYVYNFDNNPLSGVIVSCNIGTNSRNIVTDSSGFYSFAVRADSNYVIMPSKTGYTFNPLQREYNNPVNNYSSQNYRAEQTTYTITGYVKHNSSGLQGVTITVNGTPSTTTTTDSTGKYTFTAFVGNTYSVSAAKTGYSITSINGNPQSVGPVYSNQTIADFIATTLNNASIQGKVYSSGSLLAGATVRLYKNGNLESTQTTSVPPEYSGYSYSFTNLETNQNYKVTVEKAGFTFIPNEDGTGNLGVKYFNNLIGSVEQDFASNVSTKTISGNVHSATSNIANVTVNITSSSFNTSAVTGNDGNYTTTVPAGVEYILSVQDVPDIGYSFVNADTLTRTTRYSGIVVNDVVGMNFLANVKTYNIKINITGVDQGDVVNFPDIAGSGLVQITGDISGAGTYTYTNVPGLTDYTITPQSTEWNFNPSTVTYTNLIGDKEITFTAVSKKQYTISGMVIRNLDGPLSGVVLNISPGSQVVSTDASGNYSFIVNAGGSYTITPSTTTGTGKGYTFSSLVTQPIGPIYANVDSVDFVATPIGGLSISGTIYNGGTPLEGATVTLSYTPLGGSLTTVEIITGSNGQYSFDGLEAHNDYTVTVRKTGFSFIPNNGGNDGYKLFEDMIVSQVQDFASNTSNAIISGNISNSVPLGISNVPIKITSVAFNTNAITDNNGNYEALVPVGLDYRIEPLTNPDQGYHYQNTDNPSLEYRQTGYLSGNLPGQNFLAVVNTYSISGLILGLTTETVTLKLYDITGGGNILTDSTTATPSTYTYSFNNVPGLRDYLIVPVLNDYAFNPTNRTLLNLIGNKVDQNFSATKALGPVLISPLNGAQNVPIQPTFVWAAPIVGPAPTNYKLQVSTSTDFTGALEYSGNVLTYNGFTLNPSTTYYWRVQSQSLSGNNWSEIWSFTTSLSSPTLVSPACGSTTSVNPTLVWNIVPLATGYDVELKNTSTLVVTQYYNLSTTSLNITGLLNFTTYEWRVRAKNSGGTSNWSSWCSFTTDASIPALKSPISGSVGQPVNITFEWYPVPGATQYTLEYSTNPNFTIGTTTTYDVSGTSKAVSNLAINTTYFWRVKVKAPVQSQYSEVWYFSVGGAFSWNPQNIDFGNVLVGKTKSDIVTITNNGATPIIIYVDVNGNQFNSPNKNENPITIAPGAVKVITVNFAPTSTGQKTGKLLIQHNVSSQPLNPVEIPLTGTGVSTFATLTLPALIDFGTVVFNSGSRDTIITVYNNSNISGDYVHITSATFESPTGGIFEILTPFPIILEPGTTYPLRIRFNPNALGVQQNAFHVLNTTLNPDVRVQVRANVLQGDLVVTPAYVDYGKTTKTEPFKDTTIAIQNNSAQAITITGKFIVGDTVSFTLDNPTPIVLQPNQTNYVKVRFFPRTAGRKTAIFTITSNYVLAPVLYVPLTGIGGEEPVLYVDMQTIDFGILQKGQIKDTTVLIRNDGSLDLNITGKEFIGTDKAMFSFVNDGSPIVLRGGESRNIILRATGMLPIGPKNAQLRLTSNDPNNPVYLINLLATVRSTVLFKSVERIVFDTVDVGYSVDTSFVIRNDGDLNAVISKFELDGPFAHDFKLLNISAPFELSPGESKLVLLRFAPTAVGLSYAQIMINVNDPVDPVQRIIVQGWGRNVSTNPIITIDGNQTGEPIVDFGRVPIFEIRTKDIGIKNLSKYSKLRIDTMYVDSIYKQPFGYGNITFPFYINPKDLKLLTLSFNPKDKVKSYAANLNIQYSDSTMPPNKNNVIKIRMVGSVIFPGMDFDLTPVLKFGKVISGQSLKREFDIINRGESYLIVDSMVITGEDASEFVINDKTPIRIEPDTKYTSSVTFFAKKVGTKDAKLIVYSNDLFKLGEIEIWAECIVSGGQTTGITKTDEIPTSYNLCQNYPNPFNPSTKIEYSLPEADHVSIRIFNSLGQEVVVLVNEMQSAGKYIIDWQPKNLPSGIYFYKMQSSKYTSIRKMMLLK
jgi:hypothetical protein